MQIEGHGFRTGVDAEADVVHRQGAAVGGAIASPNGVFLHLWSIGFALAFFAPTRIPREAARCSLSQSTNRNGRKPSIQLEIDRPASGGIFVPSYPAPPRSRGAGVGWRARRGPESTAVGRSSAGGLPKRRCTIDRTASDGAIVHHPSRTASKPWDGERSPYARWIPVLHVGLASQYGRLRLAFSVLAVNRSCDVDERRGASSEQNPSYGSRFFGHKLFG